MQREEKKVKINHLINYYCNALCCVAGEFVLLNEEELSRFEKMLTKDEALLLYCYAVAKNKRAGVGELNLKVQDFEMGRQALEHFGLKGKIIISAKDYAKLSSLAIINNGLILEIESLLDYSQSLLSEIVDFSAKCEVAVLVNIGRDLEEVGKIVNLYQKSPVEILEEFGFLDRECYLYGLNYIDKDDQKLLNQYKPFLILAPSSDGEEGRGEINLYNFVYNDLKFGFSSGNSYNIDMLFEGKLAKYNTNNLMRQASMVSDELLIKSLTIAHDSHKLELPLEENLPVKNILDQKIEIFDDEFIDLRQKVKEVIEKYKEKIYGNS